MRLPLCLVALLALPACGDAQDALDTPEAAEATDAEAPERFEPLAPPAQAAAPAGSAGTFRFHYVRGASDNRDTTVIDGFLPPPIPREAMGSLALDAVPTYEVAVQPNSISLDVDPRRSGFVYVTVNEVGAVEAKARTAGSSLSERVSGLFRGTAYAFSFPPLWDTAEGSARLAFTDHEDDSPIGEMTLPISDRPVWAQPLTLPTVPEDTRLTYYADMTIDDPALVPILIYPTTFGPVGWGVAEFEVVGHEMRSRERNGATNLGTPYKIFSPHQDETNSEAYIVLFRP
ncbi:hypothetical protein [Rubrivirga sp. IMCC45206]|uniref:hypothetical protein n=1 Tax=Rubrivirga sp. IMCC45206 TaxID=3391614 RepID=UPI00399036F0